jgi:2-C-methyl-D-erythritol 4-phosphate cytidylyltransferase
MRATAIVVAAGSGLRFGADRPKAFVRLGGLTLLAAAMQTVNAVKAIGEVVIAVPAGMEKPARRETEEIGVQVPVKIVPGGTERQDSVRRALALTTTEAEFVIVHDAARPLATVALFGACLARAEVCGAALVATPVADTLKRVAQTDVSAADADQITVAQTIPRGGLWQAQTPQAFRRRLLIEAHAHAAAAGITATDDAELVECIGARVAIVPGSPLNLKITTRDDLRLAEAILLAQSRD